MNSDPRELPSGGPGGPGGGYPATELERLDACNVCGSGRIEELDPDCRLSRCTSCGFVFDNPRPTVAELVRFYSLPGKYDGWLGEERARDLLWKRRLRKMERFRRPGALLDVGTGIGQFLHHARRAFSEVHGTEVSDSAIRIAKDRYGLEVTRGEVDRIDFRGRTFDNVTLFHVLEHVPDPRKTVERCRELLTPGGRLFVAVPNDLLAATGKIKVFLKRAGSARFANVGKLGLPRIALDGSIREIHLSHFTPAVLWRLLEGCGLEVIEMSLDPYFAASGVLKVAHLAHYGLFRAVHAVSGVNLYDTVFAVAGKP